MFASSRLSVDAAVSLLLHALSISLKTRVTPTVPFPLFYNDDNDLPLGLNFTIRSPPPRHTTFAASSTKQYVGKERIEAAKNPLPPTLKINGLVLPHSRRSRVVHVQGAPLPRGLFFVKCLSYVPQAAGLVLSSSCSGSIFCCNKS